MLALQLCQKHYARWWKNKTTEKVRRTGNREDDPSGRPCEICAKELTFKQRRFCSNTCGGVGRRGENHGGWKGGVWLHGGYVITRVDGKMARVHRLVMEEMLGRKLVGKEEVHHLNGDRSDNRPENLELRSGPHGAGATRHCPTCGCPELHAATRN